MGMNGQIKIFAASANDALAHEIAGILKLPLGECDVTGFSDGETAISIYETVRGCDVFIVQPTSAPAKRPPDAAAHNDRRHAGAHLQSE